MTKYQVKFKTKEMNKLIAVINMLVILTVICWNYYTTIYGFRGSEVGSVSDNLSNLFTPAGYAFSIWGIIFIGMLIQGIQVLILAFGNDKSDIVNKISSPFIIANLLNCVWVFMWLSLWTGISTIVMSGILIFLIFTAIAVDKSDIQSSKILNWTIAVPIRIYLGWIIVATVANYSAYLNTTSFPEMIGEVPWFYIMSSIATIVICILAYTKSWFEIPLVGIWSFLAIFVRHNGSGETSLAYFVLACIAVIAIITIARLMKRNKLSLAQ